MKTTKHKFQLAIAAIAMVAVFASCSKDEDTTMTDSNNIVQVASSDNQFSILTAAITKAGLASTLQGAGPFTVFAPTNDAFNILFTQLGVSGLADLSAETLKPILLNHVISGNVKSLDITTGYVASLNGTAAGNNKVKIFILKNGGTFTIDGSPVIKADVMASNGMIHAVNKVILPASVVNHAINNPDFSILVQAVVKAGLVDALSAAGPFTVFAPTNEAFSKLFATLGVSGISDLTADQLTPILLYHVVSGNILASEVTSGDVPTLKSGSNISIMANAKGVKINNTTNVITTDVQGTNGVIHVIDSVLLP